MLVFIVIFYDITLAVGFSDEVAVDIIGMAGGDLVKGVDYFLNLIIDMVLLLASITCKILSIDS